MRLRSIPTQLSGRPPFWVEESEEAGEGKEGGAQFLGKSPKNRFRLVGRNTETIKREEDDKTEWAEVDPHLGKGVGAEDHQDPGQSSWNASRLGRTH